ncbi:MAG: NAD-dependent succinate-semialdehyde dehydrogenase [bacterium]|nr:NAD-dependent succinate-semialdehyde dehydrogenase [bacterium]
MTIETFNPATGELTAVYPAYREPEVERALAKAAEEAPAWASRSIAERADLLCLAAGILEDRKIQYAELMALEMGKPVREGRAEAEKSAWVCRYYADEAESLLRAREIETDASKSFVAFEPIGPVLAVMPWNFPFWQVFRFAAPNLMAGNVGLLKHASNVPGCAVAIEEIFVEAGFPEGAFQTLLVGSRAVAGLIEDPRVSAVTLTGSTPAGRAVAAKAGECLKKTVLELGGSDPYVVLSDADLDIAVEACVAGRLLNTGQSCIAAKRWIVTADRREEFERRTIEVLRGKVVGDPLSEETDVGPMARADLRDELHQQVLASVDRGARCLLGGELPDGEGAFYPVTVLTDVAPGMPAYEDELFGPVAAILPVADDEEAIRVANDTGFGLGAAVFTRDVERGTDIARRRLDAGSCFVNAFVRSDPRLPFGGIKDSGYGRELGSFGIYEFVNIKTVWVA